jgi:D-sedoheptulose 7-phosphate isomerase
MQERLTRCFEQSIRAKRDTLETALEQLMDAGQTLAECLQSGGKVLSCGNGGSAADAQHFAAELVNRFERERTALAGLALTTDSSALTSIANDDDYEVIFARQVTALGKPGDILLAISTSGNSANVVRAIEAARARGMGTIALTGGDGGRIAGILGNHDTELRAAHTVTARIQEVHLLLLHCLCDVVDEALFPAPPESSGD